MYIAVYSWLDTGTEDRKIEKELTANTEVKVPAPPPEGEEEQQQLESSMFDVLFIHKLSCFIV